MDIRLSGNKCLFEKILKCAGAGDYTVRQESRGELFTRWKRIVIIHRSTRTSAGHKILNPSA